ncbi:hypothetical protein TYRP_023773, partial [Tyrophagus putrescentiae]
MPPPPIILDDVHMIIDSSEPESDDNGNDNDAYEANNDAPRLFDQDALDDLVRDLGLTINKSLLFGSRLRERNLLEPGVTFSQYKKRHAKYSVFFQLDDSQKWLYCFDLPVSTYRLVSYPTTPPVTHRLKEVFIDRYPDSYLSACGPYGSRRFPHTTRLDAYWVPVD